MSDEANTTGEKDPADIDDPTSFELPVQADIRVVTDIQDRCRAALDATGEVQIGCADVERIDAAVLQCIGALANGLRQGSRHLSLTDRSDPFDRAVALLGFEELLDVGGDRDP